MKFIIKNISLVKKTHLTDLEEQFNMHFPKELKRYYLKFGNNKIKNCEFNIDGFDYGVNAMVSLDSNAAVPFEMILEYGKGEWIPDDLFPFARDPFGDYYFWSKNNGHVYFISGDNVDEPVEICNSISEFFTLMENGCE